MLKEVHASLAASDIERARRWYEEKFGLTPFESWPELLRFRVGPSTFSVYKTSAAGTAQNTVAIWRVADLRAEVSRLRARGVVFEDLDYGGADRTVDGIMTGRDSEGATVLNAWFRDGDGNWISMVEQSDHPGEPPAEMGVGAMLAAADLVRARAWYAEKLGLEPLHVMDEELVYWQGATHFSVYKTASAGTAKNTVAIWSVTDLRAEVAAMRARGVVFEDYDFGEYKTIDGVLEDTEDGTLNAWFKDSEGNIMGLAQDGPTEIS